VIEGQNFPDRRHNAMKSELLSSGVLSDSASVYRVDDSSVLKMSPPDFPNVAREMAERADLARTALGEELGWAVAVVLKRWEMDGVSCALFEELTSVSDRRLKRFVQLRRLTPPVLQWLRDVAALDRGVSDRAEVCLRALADCPYEILRRSAVDPLARINSGAFVARSRIMHSDFWIGNVMIDPSGSRPFVLIDWRGSTVDGFPIFDLVKFASSAGLRRKVLRAELAAHAERLGCDIEETRTYLLAALGHIWLHLEQFPPERFRAMAENCLLTLDNALNA
jgi:hypothetical protein